MQTHKCLMSAKGCANMNLLAVIWYTYINTDVNNYVRKLAKTLHCLTYLLGKYFSLEMWKEALQLTSVLATVGGERLNLRYYKRNHWRSSIPTSLLKQGQLKTATQERLCSDFCWILPGMEIPQPLWADSFHGNSSSKFLPLFLCCYIIVISLIANIQKVAIISFSKNPQTPSLGCHRYNVLESLCEEICPSSHKIGVF